MEFIWFDIIICLGCKILFHGPSVWFKYDHAAPYFICTITVYTRRYTTWPIDVYLNKNMIYSIRNQHGRTRASTDQLCAPTCGGSHAHLFLAFLFRFFFFLFSIYYFLDRHSHRAVMRTLRGVGRCTIGRLHTPGPIYGSE